MLIPDFSAVEHSSEHLDLSMADGRMFVNRTPANDWLRERGARLADLPRVWVRKSDLINGYRLIGAASRQSAVNAQKTQPVLHVPDDLRPFLSQSQILATETALRGEEKDFFAERVTALTAMIAAMPDAYATQGQDDQAVVHLHYFLRGADWYITEKDSDPDGDGQTQAFGLADLGQGYPEVGYINIQEITRLGAEMDYHFEPRTLLELKREKYPEMVRDDAPSPERDAAENARSIAGFLPEIQKDLETLRPFVHARQFNAICDVLDGRSGLEAVNSEAQRLARFAQWIRQEGVTYPDGHGGNGGHPSPDDAAVHGVADTCVMAYQNQGGTRKTYLTGMDDLGNLYGVRIRQSQVIAGPINKADLIWFDDLRFSASPTVVADLLKEDGFVPEGVRHEPAVYAIHEPYRAAIASVVQDPAEIQAILNTVVVSTNDGDTWVADARAIRQVEQALQTHVVEETPRMAILENLKNAAAAVAANRHGEAVKAGVAEPDLSVTPLERAMMRKIAKSPYIAINGVEPKHSGDTQTWAIDIIKSIKDKDVFASLLNAGLVWHSGVGQDAAVGLTDKGFSLYQSTENDAESFSLFGQPMGTSVEQFAADAQKVVEKVQFGTGTTLADESSGADLDAYVLAHIREHAPIVAQQAQANDLEHFLLGNVVGAAASAIMDAINDAALPESVRDAAKAVLRDPETLSGYRVAVGRLFYEGASEGAIKDAGVATDVPQAEPSEEKVDKAFLEARFGTDAQFGVRYTDESTGLEIPADDLPSFEGEMSSAFPDGSITNCTNYARQIQKALPAGSVQVVGFRNEDNPDSDVVREAWHPGGHDFAIVGNRYLVDAWSKLLAQVRDTMVYDLQDASDAAMVAKIYGNPARWSSLDVENQSWDRSGMDKLFALFDARTGAVAAQPSVSSSMPEKPEMVDAPGTVASTYPLQDFHIPEDGIQAFEKRVYVGDKRKARNNLAAIRLLKTLDEDGRGPRRGLSDEERDVLSAYVGWGGLPKAFRDTITGEVDSEWEDVATEMEELLSSNDLASARRSTLDAHYTSATIISAMWNGLEASGFKEGAVLEPSMGTGMFFALQPEALRERTQRFGVEMDAISARISQWLYPESRVNHDGFQHVNDLEGMMDVVIGNPPFGNQGVFDPVHPEWSDDAPSIHNYFFRKGLGQLQPGGVMAFVVSRYFLDATDAPYTAFRERLHRDAELVTAVRLPRNAFMANAGTQVVTDIVFFRKREEPLVIDVDTEYPDWVSGDGIIGQDPETGRGVPGNRYYESRPDHIMGIPALARGMYQENEPVVLPVKTADKEEENQRLGTRIRAVLNADLSARNMVWPESRLLAEQRWMSENALYAVSGAVKDSVPNDSFFLVEADVAAAVANHGFRADPDEDPDETRNRLNKAFPPRLAVRTGGYRGYAFADEMLVPVLPVPVKRPRKGDGEDAEEFSTATEEVLEPPEVLETSETPGTANAMKRAFSDAEIQRIAGMVSIRDALQRLLRAQTDERMSDADVEGYRDALNDAYDAFTGKYGLLNRPVNRRAFSRDTFSGALLSLEMDYSPEISATVAKRTGEDARPESAVKATLFFTRTQRPHILQDKADTPLDALRLSLSQKGTVDPVFIQNALRDTDWAGDWSGKIWSDLKPYLFLDLDAAMKRVKFWESPSIAWPYQEKEAALSGDILDKVERVDALLSSMRAHDALVGVDEVVRLKDALEGVMPDRVQMKDIGARFGAPWIDVQTYKDFVMEVMGVDEEPDFEYEESLALWKVHVSIPHDQQLRWGVGNVRGAKWLLEKTINRQPLLVTERLRDGSTIVLEKETEIAKQRSQELQKAWKQWVFGNEAAAQRLEDLYNRKFNRFRAPQFDGRHLELIGASSAITLRPHQKNGVWRGMQSGNVFFDHAVGAGKTFAAIALIMEMRRLGRAQKPLLVVPNHLVDQWRCAILDLYPSANVLTASDADVDAKRRQVFLGIAAYGQWDAVVIPHSLFQRIPPDPYWSGKVMEEEVSGFEDAIRALSESNPDDKRTIKRMERKVERIRSKIEKANQSTGKKDSGLTMGDLGVDMLVVDEVQEFKNLPYITEMKNVAGLGNPEGSAKAQDLYIKARSIQKMREDHGGIVYLSGTPLSNTMAELYTWMRHFIYDTLDKMGLLHFDAWQNAFADVTRDYAFTLTGQYKEKAYLSVFDNLPELRALTQQFMDTVSIADVQRMLAEEGMPEMPIPPIKDGKPAVIVSQPTMNQKEYIGFEVGEDESGAPIFNEGSILYRLDHLPKRPGKGEDNILSLSGEMSKVGLDLRAVTGKANHDDDRENGEKLIRCADEILALYKKWEEDKGTQLVFLDFSTPVSSRKRGRAKPSASDQSVLDALEAVRRYERDLEDYGEADEDVQKKSEQGQELLETLSPQEIEDIEHKYSSGEDRWSAYEALRRMLIERGIPEDEVAFAHDYEKRQEKAELYGMMRSGKKRVLIGSSQKMGAGMNVQDRLVGLHHLDAPYRPLDIDQRNGRGLRQGNKLLEKYGSEKFQVAVNYYVTEGAGDAGRWQILEFKKRFIDQYGKRNDGTRRVEDPSAQALDPARIKAESSGSDILMDKTVMNDLSKRLEVAESAWNNGLRELRRHIQEETVRMNYLEERLPFVETAAQTAQGWLAAVDARQGELDAERKALVEARKAEREQARVERQKKKAEKPGEQSEDAENAFDLTADQIDAPAPTGERETMGGRESEGPHSDARGPMRYAVSTGLDEAGHAVMEDRVDQRMSDWGRDTLQFTTRILRNILRDARAKRDPHALIEETKRQAGGHVPLARIEHGGETLRLVMDGVWWSSIGKYGNARLPDNDDTVEMDAYWLAADGKKVSEFRFSLPIGAVYAIDKPGDQEAFRSSFTAVGRKIVNAVQTARNRPQDFKDAIKDATALLASYQSEYDRLTLKNGERNEDFPQTNRLTLVNAVNYCMDTALKAGLRKGAAIDEKMEALRENLRKAREEDAARAAKTVVVSENEPLEEDDSRDARNDSDGESGRSAPAASVLMQKIEANLERLQTVAPELRYWSAHREELVEKLKDEQVDDAVFAEVIANLQNRSADESDRMDGMPFDPNQLPGSVYEGAASLLEAENR